MLLQQSDGWLQITPLAEQHAARHAPAQSLLQQSLAPLHMPPVCEQDAGQEPNVFRTRGCVVPLMKSSPLGPSPVPLSAVTRNQKKWPGAGTSVITPAPVVADATIDSRQESSAALATQLRLACSPR